jgi:hypothetical protein
MRKIQWLKWEDPLKPNEKLGVDDSQYQEQKDSFGDEDETTKHVRLISGPYGLIPIAEHGLSGGLYKLWVGHTNFDITSKIISEIENIKGVEILRVWTRYRFWLGIGAGDVDRERKEGNTSQGGSDARLLAKKGESASTHLVTKSNS